MTNDNLNDNVTIEILLLNNNLDAGGEYMEGRDLLVKMKTEGIKIDAKKYRIIICALGLICLLISGVFYYGAEEHAALMIISMPMEGIGRLLRWLSLNSKIGDILSWILYIGISIIPLICLLWKNNRSKKSLDETTVNVTSADWILLPLLSIYTFYMLYGFVNPYLLATIVNPEVGIEEEMLPVLENMVSGVFYSLLIGYFILSLVLQFKRKDIWKRTEQVLIACGILYVCFICYFAPFSLYPQFDEMPGSAQQLVGVADFILSILPMIWFISVIEAGIMLVQILNVDQYDVRSVDIASLLAERSRQTVIISVTCNMIGNLLHLVASSQTTNTNYLVSVPFVPLIIAFAGLILAAHLKESVLLYDDNQKII